MSTRLRSAGTGGRHGAGPCSREGPSVRGGDVCGASPLPPWQLAVGRPGCTPDAASAARRKRRERIAHHCVAPDCVAGLRCARPRVAVGCLLDAYPRPHWLEGAGAEGDADGRLPCSDPPRCLSSSSSSVGRRRRAAWSWARRDRRAALLRDGRPARPRRARRGGRRVRGAAGAEGGGMISATFVDDVTVPDGSVVAAGEWFVKVWRLRPQVTEGRTPAEVLQALRPVRDDVDAEMAHARVWAAAQCRARSSTCAAASDEVGARRAARATRAATTESTSASCARGRCPVWAQAGLTLWCRTGIEAPSCSCALQRSPDFDRFRTTCRNPRYWSVRLRS